jgi:hypothetical protein
VIDFTSPLPRPGVRLLRHLAGALLLLGGCARPAEAPIQLVEVSRDGAPALAVFHAPDVRINAQSVPALELDGHERVRIERGAWTADSAYFAEPPWIPRDSLRGSGKLHVSFCRADEAYCTVHTFPVRVD